VPESVSAGQKGGAEGAGLGERALFSDGQKRYFSLTTPGRQAEAS